MDFPVRDTNDFFVESVPPLNPGSDARVFIGLDGTNIHTQPVSIVWRQCYFIVDKPPFPSLPFSTIATPALFVKGSFDRPKHEQCQRFQAVHLEKF